MLVIPAIDMKDHQAVRLKQGDMDQVTVYNECVLSQAETFIAKGAKRIHLVDLNGAFEGKPVHFEEIKKISKAYPEIQIEVGGGIRSLETMEEYFQAGVDFCILGTVAVKNPELTKEACQKYPGKIILGVDAKNGKVATEGWDETSSVLATDLLKKFSDCDIESVIYTDISKDGMLQGMNFDEINKVQESGFKIIASGGLTSLDDIKKLKELNAFGVIAGKAIYENRFTLEEAFSLC